MFVVALVLVLLAHTFKTLRDTRMRLEAYKLFCAHVLAEYINGTALVHKASNNERYRGDILRISLDATASTNPHLVVRYFQDEQSLRGRLFVSCTAPTAEDVHIPVRSLTTIPEGLQITLPDGTHVRLSRRQH